MRFRITGESKGVEIAPPLQSGDAPVKTKFGPIGKGWDRIFCSLRKCPFKDGECRLPTEGDGAGAL